jgi:hypothetical protein
VSGHAGEEEICDWCEVTFLAGDALYGMLADDALDVGRLVAACSPEHMRALGGRVHLIPGPI